MTRPNPANCGYLASMSVSGCTSDPPKSNVPGDGSRFAQFAAE
jgi:hypothetical protein